MFPPPTDAIIEGFHTEFMEENHLYHVFFIVFILSGFHGAKSPQQ